MAVPFYVPDEDEQRQNNNNNNNNNNDSSQPQSTTSSATQTPLQSPLMANDEQILVQAFYEALYLYSNAVPRTPGGSSPPPSPSCCGYHGDVFFPRVMPPRTPLNGQSPQQQQQQMPWRSPRNLFNNALANRRSRTSSTSSSSSASDEDECPPQNIPSDLMLIEPVFYDVQEHMEARERLQEFTGQIPQKKKTNRIVVEPTEDPAAVDAKPKDQQNLVWPTVVTAVVLAFGCGFLVTR